MRRLVVLGVLAGCGEDPSLRVEVTHPDDAAEVITRTTITVYESPIVSCAKVEFGDLGEAELVAIEVSQIDAGSGDELTMSREGTKTIVARGFDDTGVLIAAGCGEQNLVEENDVLPISTALAASVSVSGIGLEDNDPFGLVVTVTDPFVRSLPDRAVSWRVHGSDGTVPITEAALDVGDSEWVPTQPPCTTINGLARIHPVPPSTTGGFSTSVRTSWSTEPPRVFSTFTPIDGKRASSTTPVNSGTSLSLRRCALRIAGTTRRLVCLEDRGAPTAVDYAVEIRAGGADISERATDTFSGLVGSEVPLNVFAIDRGPTTRDVYAITTRGRIVGLFSPSFDGDNTVKTVLTASVTDVAVLPACGSTPAKLLVRVEATGVGKELRTLAIAPTGELGANEMLKPYLGISAGALEQLAINATGCVAELTSGGTPIVHQVGVVDLTARANGARNLTEAVYDCGGKTCRLPLAIARAGVGFLPADGTHPERMVGATFDASGTVLSVAVIQPDNAGDPRLVEQERITAASFPNHVVTGSFDGDGLPDLFWDIVNPNTATTNFQLSYAHEVLGDRLSALSATLQDTVVVDTLVGDFDGDGHDDLAITLQDKLINPTVHRMLVLPGQIPIPPVTIVQDAACDAP